MSPKNLALTALMFLMCCKPAAPKPANILPREEMVKTMIELYIVEEKVNRITVSRDSAEKIFTKIKPKVFEKVGVADSVFFQSLRYYTERPKELEYIYAALVDSLQLREQRTPQPTLVQ